MGRIEIRFWPYTEAWTVAFWQWPHQDVVKRDQVRRAYIGFQIGPVELGFWLHNPGQYALIPQRDAHDDRRDT